MIRRRWRWFVRHVIRRSVADAELDAEIRTHLAIETERHVDTGLSRREARQRASRGFGNVLLVKDVTRDMWEWGFPERTWRDVRDGARMLRRRPGFAVVAALSLAIGIGANSTIFSFVNAIILRDLPYDRPEELVDIHLELPGMSLWTMSYPNFEDVRDGTGAVFTGVALSQFTSARVGAEAGAVVGEGVSGSYFPVLGLEPTLGRLLGPDDDRTRGAHPVVVLSHGYWERGFAGAPDVIGRELELDGRPYAIVGVAPADYPGIYRGFIRPSFYVPIMMLDELSGTRDLRRLDTRGSHNMFAKARLAPGVPLARAEAAVGAVAASLSESRPEGWDPAGAFRLVPTAGVLVGPQIDGVLRPLGSLLMLVGGLVLLLVCANLAGFLLARAVDRRREIAVRLALGAPRGVLVRQLLTETTLLGLLGGGGGLALAYWSARAVPAFDVGVPMLRVDATPDNAVLGFTLGISIAAGMLLGLVPALQGTRPDLAATLQSEAAGGDPPDRQRWRRVLVVTQLTVSLALLVVAGLFVQSLLRQQAVDPGFGASPAAILAVTTSTTRFTPDEARRYTGRLLDRFRALPGVESVGLSQALPLSLGRQRLAFTVDGHEPPPGEEVFRADRAIVDGGFFEAAGIPLLAGRTFTDADAQRDPGVVIVSRAMAEFFWPNAEAVGRLVRVVRGLPAPPAPLRVVGVAADIDWERLGEPPRQVAYLPYSQHHVPRYNVIARTSVDADQTARELVAAGDGMDPDFSPSAPTTMARHLGTVLRPLQTLAVLLSGLAVLALALATIGLYGVVSYAVASRTREVGIRIALGADAAAIRRLLTIGGLRLAAIGGGIGFTLSLVTTVLLGSRVFGIAALDPVTFIGASLVLGATALVAAYLPARRASRGDPVAALRSE